MWIGRVVIATDDIRHGRDQRAEFVNSWIDERLYESDTTGAEVSNDTDTCRSIGKSE